MKRALLVPVVAIGLLYLSSAVADARPRAQRGTRFQSNKTFGLGVMVGAPTAVNAKLFFGADIAIDVGVGAYYHYRDRDGLHVHADFLWHPVVLARNEAFWLPLYLGAGIRFLDLVDSNDENHLGVRIPIGISFDFEQVPLDVFLELAVIIDVIHDARRDTGDFGAAAGVRYWF
jgi:hypothetical protein